jgi:hypothetical protein
MRHIPVFAWIERGETQIPFSASKAVSRTKLVPNAYREYEAY